MRRFRSFLALCLALIWVPATLCCQLEAAGLEDHCIDQCCKSERPAATVGHDACSVVEDGQYRSAVPDLRVPPVVFTFCYSLVSDLTVPQAPMAAVIAPRGSKHPPDWVPVWQFERRAAAPAHAPDSSIV